MICKHAVGFKQTERGLLAAAAPPHVPSRASPLAVPPVGQQATFPQASPFPPALHPSCSNIRYSVGHSDCVPLCIVHIVPAVALALQQQAAVCAAAAAVRCASHQAGGASLRCCQCCWLVVDTLAATQIITIGHAKDLRRHEAGSGHWQQLQAEKASAGGASGAHSYLGGAARQLSSRGHSGGSQQPAYWLQRGR